MLCGHNSSPVASCPHETLFDYAGRHADAFVSLPDHIHEAVVRVYVGGALVNDLMSGDLEGPVASLPRAGHLPQLESPDQVLEALRPIL